MRVFAVDFLIFSTVIIICLNYSDSKRIYVSPISYLFFIVMLQVELKRK